MIKVYLKLRATKDIGDTGWKEGEILEMITDVFNKQNGVAITLWIRVGRYSRWS